MFWDLSEQGIVVKGFQVKLSILIIPLSHWGGQMQSFISFGGGGKSHLLNFTTVG